MGNWTWTKDGRAITQGTSGEEIDFLDKTLNLAGAGARVAKSIFSNHPITVSSEEKERRMAICADCEFFTGKSCKKCGCHIRFKAKLQTEHCPIGKW